MPFYQSLILLLKPFETRSYFCNIIVVHQVTLELQPFSKIKEALVRPMATTKVNLCFLKRDSREQFHIAVPWGAISQKKYRY